MSTVNAVSTTAFFECYKLASPSTLVIGPQVTVVSTESRGVYSNNDSGACMVVVAGFVGGETGGVVLTSGSVNRLYVAQSGIVSGGYSGASLVGAPVVTNHGEIVGRDIGLICGQYVGSSSTITNTGLIEGAERGVSTSSLADATVTLYNTGTISGGFSYSGGDGRDAVTNGGKMIGAVFLGAGNDTYTAEGAGRVIGSIIGGLGNDTFVLGAAREDVDGSEGVNTIDFRYGGGLTVDLSNNQLNTGWAAGDTYNGITRVLGSLLGADVLTGNSGDNQLFGMGGADVLNGGAGNDRLNGASGRDVMTGGAGSDRFEFYSLAQGGDVITDFTNAGAANDDALALSAAGFGAGLTAGVLAAAKFWSGASNAANDADCRFILRTTDKTVWFDADGNGAAAPVMVADLQQSATFTASDVLIF